MPEHLLPLLADLLHLPLQRRSGALLALAGPHNHPAFPGGSVCDGRPEQRVSLLLPGVVRDCPRTAPSGTTPKCCATSSRGATRMRRASAWCTTTSTPTPPVRSTRPSRPSKLAIS